MDPHRGPSSRQWSASWSRLVPWIGLLILFTACGSSGGESRSPASAAPASAVVTYPSPTTNLAPVGATETARVVRVVDGDTIVIDRGHGDERVRYIGIDTPESVKPNTPVEFMAKEASAANEALLAGRDVVLERDVSDTDQYDRLLRYVWLREGDGWEFVNLELVRRGYAQVATYPPDVRWTDTFLAAQREARKAGVGLWGPVTPTP
jgi:endonuclease YncB( thermonuclease family)